MLKFNVITLFPELFEKHIENLPFKRAEILNVAQYNTTNLRDFAIDKRGTVDDKTYGGGVGMLLRIEPIYNALKSIYGQDFDKSGLSVDAKENGKRIILMSPRGKRFNQKIAQELSQATDITFISGRYEGVDARVEENFVTDVISIGDYVLSGGELPSLVVMESITRLLPGVLDKEGATEIESFSNDTLEFPQYTRPEDFDGLKVPEILLSGNHKEIEQWRIDNSEKLTQ